MDRLERDGIAESISFILRDPVHVLDELLIAIALFDLPPSEHSLLGGNHDVGWKRCELSEESSVVHKAWDVAGDEAVHHAADPDNLAGEDAGVDGRLGIVSHDAPQELHPGGNFAEVIFHVHRSIRVLQIAVAGSSTEIDPAT